MQYVRRLPCAICVLRGFVLPDPQPFPISSAHHPRTGVGAARKSSDEDTIPLCPGHHQYGAVALHVMGRKAWERHFGVTEGELTAETRERVRQMIELEVR